MLPFLTGISKDSQTPTRLSSNGAGWTPISGQTSSCDWLIVLACWIPCFWLLGMLLHVGRIVGLHQSRERGWAITPPQQGVLAISVIDVRRAEQNKQSVTPCRSELCGGSVEVTASSTTVGRGGRA